MVGAPNTHTSVPYGPAKVFFDTWDGGVETAPCQKLLFRLWGDDGDWHNAKKIVWGPKLVPTCACCNNISQQRCFRIPLMMVFELHSAKKYCLGSAAALQTTIPLYPISQQSCFLIPPMMVSELHSAKNLVWVLGWPSKHPYHCTPSASKGGNFSVRTASGSFSGFSGFSP